MLNENLIGIAGGRWKLQTPALVVDLDILERNIAHMAAHAKAAGVGVRAHAKTHKSVEISKRQIAAGAVGVCCAKLGEAEALAAGGIESILLTSPVVSDGGIVRLMALNARMADLMAVCDSGEIATKLNAAAGVAGKVMKIIVDIDPGLGRTGIGAVLAPDLVAQIAASEHLHFAGLQWYAGQVQHMHSTNERRAASLTAIKDLVALRDTLVASGHPPAIISGGGTGTFDIDIDAKILNELQVGSYVFMDRQYIDVWTGERPPFETSLFVQTTVISTNRAGLVTTDAGLKAFATDDGTPVIAHGAPPGAAYFFYGDEQGGVIYSEETGKLRHGAMLACVVPHCDPTVNLYDYYHAVRGDVLEAIWPVDGRGRSA